MTQDVLMQIEKDLRLLYLDYGIAITSKAHLARWISLIARRFFLSVEGQFCHAFTPHEIQARFRRDLADEAQIVGLHAPTLSHFDVQQIVRVDVHGNTLNLELTAYGRAIMRQLPDGEDKQMPQPQFEDPLEALFT